MRKTEFPESLPITVFAIHGNHGQRPKTIEGHSFSLFDNLFSKDNTL